jgi:hypothetical protein
MAFIFVKNAQQQCNTNNSTYFKVKQKTEAATRTHDRVKLECNATSRDRFAEVEIREGRTFGSLFEVPPLAPPPQSKADVAVNNIPTAATTLTSKAFTVDDPLPNLSPPPPLPVSTL